MLKEKTDALKRPLILLDIIIVTLCFFASFFLRQKFQSVFRFDLVLGANAISGPPSSIGAYFPILFIVVPLWGVFLYMNGSYANIRTKRTSEVVWIVTKAALFVGVGLSALIFLLQYKYVSRLFFIIFLVVSAGCIIAEKMLIIFFLRRNKKRGLGIARILIVGTGGRAASLIARIRSHPEWEIEVIGILDDEPGRGIEDVAGIPIMGNLDNLAEIIRARAIDEMFFVVPRSRLSHIEAAVLVCETVGVKARVAMDLFDLKVAKSSHIDLDGLPFVSFKTTVASESQLLVKRAIDVILSGAGIIILGPLMMVMAALIKLTSRGPVLFKQHRVGSTAGYSACINSGRCTKERTALRPSSKT